MNFENSASEKYTPKECIFLNPNYDYSLINSYIYVSQDRAQQQWYTLAQALGVENIEDNSKLATYLCIYVFTPFGICRGSEKQGGQHQGIANKAVTWPVDYVQSFVVDGKIINMRNLWHSDEIAAGDDLCLSLQVAEQPPHTYTLSSHPNSRIQQTFSLDAFHGRKIYQLVPVVNMDTTEKNGWHIARSHQMQRKNKRKHSMMYASNADSTLNDPILTAVFSPMYRP
jgi:hypothetical protein